MLFTLEALRAKHGDALLLHYGPADNPKLIVIDGGPGGVYKDTLSPRLMAIKGDEDKLKIKLVMVSHIDDDHVNGILQCFKEIDDWESRQKSHPFEIAELWHNSFDDIIGNDADELTASLKSAATAASKDQPIPANLPISREAALVVASVAQGRTLRNLADKLSTKVNHGGGLMMVPDGAKGKKITCGHTLTLTVLGPPEARVKALQDEWRKQIKKMGVAKAAEFVDQSVYNLSSLIVLAKMGNHTMLLTGDARGDDILEGLQQAKLLKQGGFHADVFKVPHHGSDNNVRPDFFEQVTADHYIISGDGKYGNPETSTLQMILDARGSDKYTIHLTYKLPKLTKFFQKDKRKSKRYQVEYGSAKQSLQVDLGDPLSF